MVAPPRSRPSGTVFFRPRAADVVFTLLILLASAAWAGFIGFGGSGGRAERAVIFHHGVEIARIDLDRSAVVPVLEGRMAVESRPGALRVVRSDCRHGVCMAGGWHRTPGTTITCMPNRILIRVEGPRAARLDAVVR